jgi:hypothetical protein
LISVALLATCSHELLNCVFLQHEMRPKTGDYPVKQNFLGFLQALTKFNPSTKAVINVALGAAALWNTAEAANITASVKGQEGCYLRLITGASVESVNVGQQISANIDKTNVTLEVLQAKPFALNVKVLSVEGSAVKNCPNLKGSDALLTITSKQGAALQPTTPTSTIIAAPLTLRKVKTPPVKKAVPLDKPRSPSANSSAQQSKQKDIRTQYSGTPDKLQNLEIPPAPSASTQAPVGQSFREETLKTETSLPEDQLSEAPSSSQNLQAGENSQKMFSRLPLYFLGTVYGGYNRVTLSGSEVTAFLGENYGLQLGTEYQFNENLLGGIQLGVQQSQLKGVQEIPSNLKKITLTWKQPEFYPSVHVTFLPLGTYEWGVRAQLQYFFGFQGKMKFQVPEQDSETYKILNPSRFGLEAQTYFSFTEWLRVGGGIQASFGRAALTYEEKEYRYSSQGVLGRIFLETSL